jgi:hypothetical protein
MSNLVNILLREANPLHDTDRIRRASGNYGDIFYMPALALIKSFLRGGTIGSLVGGIAAHTSGGEVSEGIKYGFLIGALVDEVQQVVRDYIAGR